MTDNPLASAMFLRGSIILLGGNLAGIPFGLAIRKRRGDEVIRAWRVAHSGNTAGGAVIIAIGAAFAASNAAGMLATVAAYSFLISGYGFSVALPIAAHLGYRGLPTGGPLPKRIVFVGNLAGALGSLAGSVALVALFVTS